ncbi:MAG: UTP--glucose-1-phosphate uridylyltransferase [Verrucomicrobia bacterium]|nr:UTP--glucose-1-phosphate uridylyltransferase [Verrucomicrobiota bacterium]
MRAESFHRPVKAVLPAAGFGTRFLPITKAVPKEMLPVGDRPVIDYVVQEAVAAGFTDILIIVSREKNCILDYFDRNHELERRLRSAGKHSEADELERIASQANFHFVRQPEMKGLGDAVLQAQAFVGKDPFALLLADTMILDNNGRPGKGDSLNALVSAHLEHRCSSVAIEPVAAERIHRYGVVGGRELHSGQFELKSMVEKPQPDEAPTMLDSGGQAYSHGFAFAARYLFTARIFDFLRTTQPGKNNEIQLTDAMAQLLVEEGFYGCRLPGKRLDIGNAAGLLEAHEIILKGKSSHD